MAELDVFFKRTGYPRAPRFYIMKWLTDYITEFGIDGYRVDTVKHTEEFVWQEFKIECDYAFTEWKNDNPNVVLDDNNFYLVGEVYNYGIGTGKTYDFGDKQVNYFDKAFHSLINFDLKWNAEQMPMDAIFTKYDSILNNELKGYSTLNYLSSHDDGQPFDPKRENAYKTATFLLLAPGASQVYYGDESARSLVVEGTQGDATLRSLMNWEDIENNSETQKVLAHWQKLGKFRANHPAIGAGRHNIVSKEPYLFSRTFVKDNYVDNVMVGLDLPVGEKTLDVSTKFNDGDEVHDAYSGNSTKVTNGKVIINSEFDIVLLEKK
jgi:alpha-amylase